MNARAALSVFRHRRPRHAGSAAAAAMPDLRRTGGRARDGSARTVSARPASSVSRFCVRCGAPFAHSGQGGRDRLCPYCLADEPPWGRARAALRYDLLSRRVVLAFKNRRRTEYAAALAPLIGARRGGIAARGRGDRAGAAAPAPADRASLQPGRAARPCARPAVGKAGGAGRAAAHQGDRAAGRFRAGRRAAETGQGRVRHAAQPIGRIARPARAADRRRAPRRASCGPGPPFCCKPERPGWTCWWPPAWP